MQKGLAGQTTVHSGKHTKVLDARCSHSPKRLLILQFPPAGQVSILNFKGSTNSHLSPSNRVALKKNFNKKSSRGKKKNSLAPGDLVFCVHCIACVLHCAVYSLPLF